MAFANKTGINVASGFKLEAPSPIDARFTLETLADRDELVTLGAVYTGLTVYVEETETLYLYYGESTWGTVTSQEAVSVDSITTEEINEICS